MKPRSLAGSGWVMPTLVAALIAALAVALAGAWAPPLGSLLEFSRTRVAEGEWWRLLSGFMAHWTPAHAIANGLGMAGFGYLIARCEGLRAVALIFLLATLAQLPCLLLLGADAEYRGASGFVYALAVFAWLRSLHAGNWRWRLALLPIAPIVMLRLAADIAGSGASPLLANENDIAGNIASNIASTWQVHATGLAAGASAFWLLSLSARLRRRDTAHGRNAPGVA